MCIVISTVTIGSMFREHDWFTKGRYSARGLVMQSLHGVSIQVVLEMYEEILYLKRSDSRGNNSYNYDTY